MSDATNAKAAATGEAKAGVIVDRGYTRYDGPRTPEAGRWAVIARQMLRTTARQPWVIVLLVLTAFPTVISGVVLYIAVRVAAVSQTGMLDGKGPQMVDPRQIVMMPWGTLTLAFFLALFAGAGQVADDARAGAFQIYFARPVTREQYLVGKLVPVLVLTAAASLVPTLLLALMRMLLMATGAEMVQALPLVGAALLTGVIEALALALPALAVSSLSKRRGWVQGLFAIGYLLPWLLGSIFTRVTRSAWPAVLSLPAHLENLARILARQPAPDTPVLPWWASLAFVALLVGGALVLLRRRLGAVEVVAS